MRIAICENNKVILEDISNTIKAYFGENQLGMQVDSFSSSEPLMDTIESKKSNPYSIIFLNAHLDGKSYGIEIAHKIRQYDNQFILIFMADSAHIAEYCFAAKTFGFFVVPSSDNALIRILQRLCDEINCTETLTFISNRRKVTLLVQDILYITGQRNGIEIHTQHACYFTYSTLNDISKYVRFPVIRCHGSFFVNLKYIAEYTHSYVKLTDGHSVKISRKYYSEFHKNYNLYR